MAIASGRHLDGLCVSFVQPVPSDDTEGQEAVSRSDSDQSNPVCDLEVARTATQESKADKVRASFKAPEEWMVAFGCALAACAGVINVAALLQIGTFVGNVTGLLCRLGMHLEGARVAVFAPTHATHNPSRLVVQSSYVHLGEVETSLLILTSFMFGAFLCGLVIPKNMLSFGGKSFYGTALLGESLLLVNVAIVSSHESCAVLAACLAACACGLQNAMCTMHLGAVVRTTHVTGTATDIGSSLGRATMNVLRRRFAPQAYTYVDKVELEVDTQKFRILTAILACYLLGAFSGTFLERRLGHWAFLVPAGVTGLLGVVYTFFRESLKVQLRRVEAQLMLRDQRQVGALIGRMEKFLSTLKREQHMVMSEGRRSTQAMLETTEALQVMTVLNDMAQQFQSERRSERRPTSGSHYSYEVQSWSSEEAGDR